MYDFSGRTVLVPRPWNRRAAETDERGSFCVEALRRELWLAARAEAA